MRLGVVGLGRMGGNMVTRLLRGGHEVVAYDRSAEAVRGAATGGARGADSLEALVRALAPPRHVWLMVPAGEPTEATIQALAPLLARGDTLVDGGNTRWTDDVRRARELAGRGLDYVDVGTSGGLWGLANGYCLMVGGARAAVERLAPVFTTLAPPDGWLHVGGSGSGHYVKMVHNGIEYAMMQAYAEGFELMSASEYGLDLPGVAHLWNQGSVIRSWLLELTADALRADPTLAGLKPWVEDSGEGRWTVEDAVEKAVPAPTITAALFARFRSRRENSFADRLLAALRQAFGGHAVRR
ncbi:MAG: 6-phosphogluconate dehydrogenase (decarboxylating) [Candidatus Rokubacteria bacterium RIFCSPLOWO2_02_FULL_73_56]|nr:MAG: 6-phosphogluconate dehydrogenase (decarboxylating) [Candidatus Rokubacteria bacterium RIFCSPHIGHO2_02_FULL_73_26]OGL08161.1 MAG: 6-phosphogluconate dehydrogenase (decarboxylating) [Candidatus Rokubacteria bacterium RIFCSPLOWO2_02_FULL_73_56]OGL24591.1 MAG: 6-phosphogluconate dehydrogenase (decarboxylating) [Candidatus Rokubacteria bacterium RIFCSPLOWO2_12_FULL_73_47]